MRSKLSLLMMQMAFLSNVPNFLGEEDNSVEEIVAKRAEKVKQNKESLNKKRGLKPFTFGRETIWALNKKNALKKAAKQGLV